MTNRTETTPRDDRICIVGNEKSGRGEASLEETLAPWLAQHPDRITLRVVEQGSELADTIESAVADGFGTIVAAGGDGTMNAVARAVSESGRRMGILPRGTFNYYARGLGIPEDIEGAFEVLLGGNTVRIDLGEVNGHTFLNNASLGAYPAILQQREKIYRRWGRSRVAAFWSGIKTLAQLRKPLRLKITVDGQVRRLKTPNAFVARSAYQLREFGLEGAEHVETGRFALLTAPDCGRFRLIWNALRLAIGGAKQGRDFELFSGREIDIETSRSHALVAFDGERSRMEGPFRFRLRENALEVIVPENTA